MLFKKFLSGSKYKQLNCIIIIVIITDEPGIHGTIEKVIDSDGSSSLQISDDFIIEKLGLCFIHIKHKNSKFSTYFLKPSKSLSNLHKKSVSDRVTLL